MPVYQTSASSATLQRSGVEYVAVLLDKGLVDDAYQTMRVQFDEGVQAARNGWPVNEWEPAARRMGYIAMAERLAASGISLDDEPAADCTCTPLSVMACPACLATIAARWGDEVPF